jgi:DNA transposition AAA+ family ATPase
VSGQPCPSSRTGIRAGTRTNPGCLTLSADDFTDAEALAAVAHITGGSFRLVQRLFAQIQRIMEINNLSTVTREVVETVRSQRRSNIPLSFRDRARE